MPRTDAQNTGDSAPEVWDQAARAYDDERARDPVYLSCVNEVVRHLGAQRVPWCLDAGCGTGMTTLLCAQQADGVVAVDYSYESLAVLRRKAAGLPILLVQADIKKLPFRDGIFDRAVCANTLQHLRQGVAQQQAVEELRRVTSQDGRIAVSVHHYSRAKRRAKWVKEGKPGQQGIDYIFRFSRRELAALTGGRVSAVGFYELAAFHRLSTGLQSLFFRLFGGLVALAGEGHMLIASIRKARRRR